MELFYNIAELAATLVLISVVIELARLSKRVKNLEEKLKEKSDKNKEN